MPQSAPTKLEQKLLNELDHTNDLEQRRRILKHLTRLLQARAYNRANPEAVKNRKRRWIANNPEKWREISRRNMRTYLSRKRAEGKEV